MFAVTSQFARALLLFVKTPKHVSAIVVLILLWSVEVTWAKPLYPVALMNWMMEGNSHAIIVDKSQQLLSVWSISNGAPAMIESFRCSTGQNEGDKWDREDMRTPEGVYFFCSLIDGSILPPKYGSWAFTTDYPNFVDRRRGKNGDGIWLHGRDKPLGSKPDSAGCIALENRDLIRVSRFIRLQSTPLIVVKELIMVPKSSIIEQEGKVRNFVEAWRRAWESMDVDAYMQYYSPNFQSYHLDFSGWKEKKLKLYNRHKQVGVKLGNIYLYRHNGLITAIFPQFYSSETFKSSGIKILYIATGDKFGIYAEDYHRTVDDPYPTRVLLASAHKGLRPRSVDRKDYGIQLISTDEPDFIAAGEIETPRISPPSRGGLVDKIMGPTSLGPPPVEANDKLESAFSSNRLILPCITYANDCMEKVAGSLINDHTPGRYIIVNGDIRGEICKPEANSVNFQANGLAAALNPIKNRGGLRNRQIRNDRAEIRGSKEATIEVDSK